MKVMSEMWNVDCDNKIKWLPMSTATNNISKLAYGPEKGHPFAYYTNTGNHIG